MASGPEHYRRAEQLLEHAAGMLAENVAREDVAELVARQAVVVSEASAHAVLAVAAVLGMSAPLDAPESQAWRDAARTHLT
jgi:hypothetical protein